jgi:hypothetical protein
VRQCRCGATIERREWGRGRQKEKCEDCARHDRLARQREYQRTYDRAKAERERKSA